MDSRFSIDTISEISQHEASPVTTSSPRTAFEQQLCTHLLNLSEVAETLADRVMALEARLAEVEKSQIADDDQDAISDDAGELLSASEEKVRLLRDRLAPAQGVALHAEGTSPSEPQGVCCPSRCCLPSFAGDVLLNMIPIHTHLGLRIS